MRDDLHRTTAVTRPLRRVLRYACRPADRHGRLHLAIEEAVRLTLRGQIRSDWLKAFHDGLVQGRGDLFGDAQLRETIRACAKSAVTPLEREVAERVRAIEAFQGSAACGLSLAVRDIAVRVEERAMEHLASAVPEREGRELRSILKSARTQCAVENLIDDSGGVTPVTRLPSKKIDLDEPLES